MSSKSRSAAASTPEPSLGSVRADDRPRERDGTSDVEGSILAAAERLLEGTPFHDISVAQLLTEAGISRATFYFYFSSKWAVLVALVARVMQEMEQQIDPFVSRQPDIAPRDALRESIVAGAELWAGHRMLFRAVHEHWTAVPELREIWLQLNAGFTDRIAAEIDREREAGEAPAGLDSRQLASMLVWSSGQLMFVAGLEIDPSLRDELALIEPLADLWLSAVFGDAR